MKFPKIIKNPTLCQVITYVPALIFVIYMLFMAFVEDVFGIKSSLPYVFLFLLLAFTIYYIFHNIAFLFVSETLFSVIRAWKKTRLWYESDCNGSDRKTAEQKLINRGKSCGKICEPTKAKPVPLMLRYRRCYSWMVFWASIEKISMVYSTDYLDTNEFRNIVNSAVSNINAQHTEPKFFIDRNKKKAPVATASVAVIVADSISDDIPELVQKEQTSCRQGYLLLCVYDISSKRYYFDGMAEIYSQGMMGKPEKNYALSLLKKLVFNGRLPLRGNQHYVPLPSTDEYSEETTLWELIRNFNQEIKETKGEGKKIAKNLNHGEVLLKNGFIYCKLSERTARFSAIIDEEDPLCVSIIIVNYWAYPKSNRISKKDAAEIKQRIEAYLLKNGYNYDFVEFKSEN